MEQDSIFLLRSELLNWEKGQTERSFFEHILQLRFLRETGRDASIYDPELKMHFINRNAWASLYEIETADVSVKCSRRLQKAEDFIRRIHYRYDWIQIQANANGKVLSIENKNELKQRWTGLKAAIEKDYRGDVVKQAVEKIDSQFGANDQIASALSQYTYFGLLFPGIPENNNDTWSKQRMVEFSEYEEEKFEERITYNRLDNDLRKYKIEGHVLPESNTTIDRYEGTLEVEKGGTFPESGKIDITYRRDGIINQWSFTVLRYK